MAIQNINLGTAPNGVGGDTLRSTATKINENFTDATNAASRIVGTVSGQIPTAENTFKTSFGLLLETKENTTPDIDAMETGTQVLIKLSDQPTFKNLLPNDTHAYAVCKNIGNIPYQMLQTLTGHRTGETITRTREYSGFFSPWITWNTSGATYATTTAAGANVVVDSAGKLMRSTGVTYSTLNTTKDSNGFLKGASPVVDLYNDRIEQNADALKQTITFEKVDIGDYLVKGSLGFSKDGWHIETPKDTNGNVLVAVVEKQLENNDLSIKTYAKRFDDETGDIGANLLKPRDIPLGRFISLRLHEVIDTPVEPSKEPYSEV